MGLDSVELVMEFEEAFGVELRDEEVTQTVTPRMVIDLIFSKLKTTDERVCQSQRAFYILRRAFISMFGLDKKSISPDMQFRSLLPRSREKATWEQIRASVAARSWPKLVRPAWMSRPLIGMGFAIVGAAVWAAAMLSTGIRDPIIGAVMLAGLLVAGIYASLAVRLTRPFQVRIPSHFKSIRDLIPYVITSDHIKWTREQVAARVRQIVMDQLGLRESQYTEDSRFVQDFHVD